MIAIFPKPSPGGREVRPHRCFLSLRRALLPPLCPAVKTTIPDALKQDLPATKWGKTLSATPVFMTVVATLLAGLASSEMTRGQYDRALGAQLQSKAGDQWSYFQAKKMRGAMQRNSLELLQAIGDIHFLSQPELQKIAPLPTLTLAPLVEEAIKAVETLQTEEEIATILQQVEDAVLVTSLKAAKENVQAYDAACAPLAQTLDQLEKALPGGDKAAARDLTATRMRLNSARYDAEAKLNQSIANVYELQVRKANASAERHRRRSSKFFFGMLAAQAAVVTATLALAAQKRSFLWSIAAAAGVAAIVFAAYVYVKV